MGIDNKVLNQKWRDLYETILTASEQLHIEEFHPEADSLGYMAVARKELTESLLNAHEKYFDTIANFNHGEVRAIYLQVNILQEYFRLFQNDKMVVEEITEELTKWSFPEHRVKIQRMSTWKLDPYFNLNSSRLSTLLPKSKQEISELGGPKKAARIKVGKIHGKSETTVRDYIKKFDGESPEILHKTQLEREKGIIQESSNLFFLKYTSYIYERLNQERELAEDNLD